MSILPARSNRHPSHFAPILAALLTLACHRSGTWADDPKNVERAWGVELPADVKLRHSWYWRFAHFTLEEAYYFQFAWNPQLFEGFITENRMRPSTSPRPLSERTCFERPPWFAPGDPAAYDAWVGPASNNGVLLRHKQTKELFIAACQM